MLFGAGASNGSGGLYGSPPLGKDLLELLSHEYPETWGRIPTRIRDSFIGVSGRPDFESGMAALYEGQLRDEVLNLSDLLKDMGKYFSHFTIRRFHNNQYHKFLVRFRNELLSGKIVLATLNYDCLIEHAASRENMSIEYWGENESGVRLLKLHGSCNFLMPGIAGKGSIIIKGTLKGSLMPVTPERVDEVLDNNPAPPAMSLYNLEKTNMVCPEQILKMREMYEHCVRDARLAIVVGVHPRLSGDDHVWNPLIRMDGALGMVCSHDSVADWRRVHRAERLDPLLPSRFMDAYPDICALVESAML